MKKNISQRHILSFLIRFNLALKLTILLLLLTVCSIHAKTYSQNIKLTYSLKDITIVTVLEKIEKDTKFKFLFNNEEINVDRIISFKVENEEVAKVLDKLFLNSNITYKFKNKQIILKQSKDELVETKGQQITIKGTVKDPNGMPIPGANVLVKGTTLGTTTDIDGNYVLVVPESAKIIVFSYLGLKSTEVAIAEKTTINVTLQSDAATLDEIVVIGYGTVKKSDLTGSVASADVKELNKTQNTSIAQAIQGRMAGVTVSKSSGAPGATPTVRVRGFGTVNNADPLYIVDGIPINDISSINMEDAKSIEVLKDASATAIYGSRGANGVVLITTKSGLKGKTIISYTAYAGVQNRIDNLKVMNAEQWATLFNEGLANDGRPLNADLINPASLPSYNWKDLVYRSANIQSHQLSASGGSDKSTFYVSFGYIDQEGVVMNSSYNRTNFRVNNTYQILPKIKLGHNIQYAKAKTRSVAEFGNSTSRVAFLGYLNDPVSPIYNPDGTFGISKYNSIVANPLAFATFVNTPSIRESFLGDVSLDVDIIEGLKFKSNLGLQINNTKVDNFVPAYFVSSIINSALSTYTLNRSENRVYVMSNTLNYNVTLAKKHNFSALLGQEIQELDFNNVNTTRNDIPPSVINPTLSSGSISSATNSGDISESRLLSFFGRFNYNYDDRYLLTGTFRKDGSSRFGSNNRWANFPSLALAWNIHKENFYNVDAINQLKFRLGWGKTGNQDIPNSAIYNTLNIGTNYPFGLTESTTIGVTALTPGNSNLKWETTVTKNIGLDLAFLNNSITFTADYFIKNTTDMLMPTPILSSSGYRNSPFTNAGDIQNDGFEFTANYKKVINDFSFNIGGNIAIIQNKVLKLATEGTVFQSGSAQGGIANVTRTEAGHPLASFYGLEMIGVFQNQDEINSNPNLVGTKPGDVKYKDQNNDGVINDSDRTYIGSPLPNFTYGINLNIDYKQFDFSAFFQGSEGNKIFNASDYDLMGDLSTNLNVDYLGRWTGEGTSNSIPRASFASQANNSRTSSRFVQDGSYLRLKNIQLGYSLPMNILNKIALDQLRFYVSAQNLLTFTKYNGLDPEVGVDNSQNNPLDIGIDRGRYPSVRTISLGLNLTF
ncbi:TonB-linked outer membrane protein, SusC/RagA family [Flavobacterium flevense]|uniref:SusC/RagA family TonB-linked outer membrane protein n=1 Tax=Flavobacterium flevense TaxID=983 RepID=A0A4Y4AZC8_9FLAO|nr:TonB-dependent receptor [Flavobacterium flevense]GEC72502.1 SusC/RagA family TonB-linked outer membrane protein [Flavobacterium flevense]SHM13707.1 TonB-linked outer membrane protein, SusC/RagA family [Flavobacterium flevense]